MKLLYGAARTAVFALCLVHGVATAESGPKPAATPIADFFRLPAIDSAIMSPNGQYIAATVKGGPKGRLALVVLDITDLTTVTPVALYADGDVVNVRWVNNSRLLFGVVDLQAIATEPQGPGLFAVHRDGRSAVRTLIRRGLASNDVYGVVNTRGSRIGEAGLSPFHRLQRTLRDGTHDIIVARDDFSDTEEFVGTTLFRVDTVSGTAKVITLGAPGGAWRWVVDAKGQPRALITTREGKSALHWKVFPDAPWREIARWKSFGEERSEWFPLGIDAANRLYATARIAGESDFEVIQRLDPAAATGTWQEVLALKGFDFYGALRYGEGDELIGVDYLTDAEGTHWLDEGMRAIQKEVDAQLPGQINQISCGTCIDRSAVLVKSWSDRQPVVYRVYEPERKRMRVLSASRPWIKPAAMGHKQLHWVKARDGLSMPVYVTRPAEGAGPFPAVVMVHGGPFVRGGEWEWEPHAQFLASRGYLVIEPEFRGSRGFGFRHFRAGWKQWGLAMQDDLADAAKWAVGAGLADAKRIGIAGSSYGGYAAMMGLVRHGELYRCAINWAGPTDIELLYTARWNDLSAIWKDYGMPILVGDREKDAAQLASTSPLKQADRIRRPVLLAYGGEDRRVPVVHGLALRKAIEKHNKDVEWVEYKDEGHGWRLESTQMDFWGRVERFLERHLKSPPSPSP